MKIVWFSWKDHAHPASGGAEAVKSEIARRLAADGHDLVIITARYPGSAAKSNHDGYSIIRGGNRFTVYWFACRYYRRHLRGWADLAIDEMNTIPFFARFYAGVPSVLLAYQLARKVWFHEIFFPLSIIGYCIEPLYLRLINTMPVLTISESSRQDIARHGFDLQKVHIFPMASPIAPLPKLPATKQLRKKLLILGAIRSMKQPTEALKAFEIAKQTIPELTLDIAGGAFGKYGVTFLSHIESSPFAKDITYHGRVSTGQKIALMKSTDYLLVASQKEGWGLIVTEAASQGAVSIVYDADGLRDAVFKGKGGILCEPKPAAMAAAINLAYKKDQSGKRIYAYQQSRRMTFDRSYAQFLSTIKTLVKP